MIDVIKKQILHLLEKDATPRPLALLEQELGIGPEFRGTFNEAMDSLGAQGRVIIDSRNRVRLPSLSEEVTGVFRAHVRGFGFVTLQQFPDEGEVFIPAKACASAMTGDRVLVYIKRAHLKKDQDRLTGRIVRVLDRAHTSVIGMLCREQDFWLVQPDGGDFFRPIQVEGVDTRKVRVGDKVVVQIRSYPTTAQPARGVVTQVLGHTGRYDTEIHAIIKRHKLYDAFEPSALVEACNAKAAFDPRDTGAREDLTDHLIITIDPPDAQDFDDAVSLTRDEQGLEVLGVHIADVSHFVLPGSALDRCARQRGNSVYLPGRTLPMLPEILSHDICSLQPDKPRYTKSVFLTYNKDGEVHSIRFANTVIRSKARLTYQQVDRALKGHVGGLAREVVRLLHDMETLARHIEKRRCWAGMLQLHMPGIEVILDESGQVIGVQPEDTCYPHTIIEMFMVEANVAVASLLDRCCIPFMRRIHPAPNPTALRRLAHTLRLLGVTFARQPQRADFQKLLAQVQGTNSEIPVNLLVLRSLERAAYAGINMGHYALAASKYCHFTSPIRRYADLLVHRVLHDYLNGRIDRARQHHSISELNDIGRHISDTEQGAEDAEQELKTILILHLLHQHINHELEGVVVGLTAFGASVYLRDYGVEGLLRSEALGPDIWQYDEQHQCLAGRHTGTLLRLGQYLRVRIVEVHPSARKLDLTPATELVMKKTRRTRQQKTRRQYPSKCMRNQSRPQ